VRAVTLWALSAQTRRRILRDLRKTRGDVGSMDAGDAEGSDPVIHQAEGVLASELRVPVAHAQRILRLHARSRGVGVEFVAGEVVAALTGPADPNIAGSC
jgi:hypothetical protein